MACLTARSSSNGSSGNRELLHKSAAAARECGGEFYAVISDSTRTRLGSAQVRTLIDDAVLAGSLGAKILWLDCSDVVGGLLRLAHQFRIGRIFVLRNRPAPSLSRLFGRPVYSDLLSRAEGLRIDVVGFERGN